MRTMEAIKINKRAMISKCYSKSQLNAVQTARLFYYYIINKKKTDIIENIIEQASVRGLFCFCYLYNRWNTKRLGKKNKQMNRVQV